MEHQGAEPDNAVRPGVSRPAGLTPAQSAADKFIAEREAERLSGLDIAKHTRFKEGGEGAATYAGTRRSEGHSLALLRRGGEVAVMPIDEATASRLQRMSVGASVTVTAKGAIRGEDGADENVTWLS